MAVLNSFSRQFSEGYIYTPSELRIRSENHLRKVENVIRQELIEKLRILKGA